MGKERIADEIKTIEEKNKYIIQEMPTLKERMQDIKNAIKEMSLLENK